MFQDRTLSFVASLALQQSQRIKAHLGIVPLNHTIWCHGTCRPASLIAPIADCTVNIPFTLETHLTESDLSRLRGAPTIWWGRQITHTRTTRGDSQIWERKHSDFISSNSERQIWKTLRFHSLILFLTLYFPCFDTLIHTPIYSTRSQLKLVVN